VNGKLRALRWWLRASGVLTFAGGVACILAAPTWVPSLVVGIALTVYGIAALSTEVAPRPAGR
jgi:uncharacterized membrane protein HdeD (DUF308 family)